LVRPEVKQLVDAQAKASGRTQSQEAEMMIEGYLLFKQRMGTLSGVLSEMERGNVEAALWRLGYTPVRMVKKETDGSSTAVKLWAEPGSPFERSGFVPQEEGAEK
jgi:hypothetical protein